MIAADYGTAVITTGAQYWKKTQSWEGSRDFTETFLDLEGTKGNLIFLLIYTMRNRVVLSDKRADFCIG